MLYRGLIWKWNFNWRIQKCKVIMRLKTNKKKKIKEVTYWHFVTMYQHNLTESDLTSSKEHTSFGGWETPSTVFQCNLTCLTLFYSWLFTLLSTWHLTEGCYFNLFVKTNWKGGKLNQNVANNNIRLRNKLAGVKDVEALRFPPPRECNFISAIGCRTCIHSAFTISVSVAKNVTFQQSWKSKRSNHWKAQAGHLLHVTADSSFAPAIQKHPR